MSDKYDEVAERIYLDYLSDSGQHRTGVERITAILREAFPIPSGQDEDERALREIDELMSWHHKHNDPSEPECTACKVQEIARAALLSRPAVIPRKPKPACPVCHGSGLIYESHGSPYGSVASNCPACAEQPDPAQAAPSEEDVELIRKALRRYVSPWSSAEEQALDRLRAALASERAKRDEDCPVIAVERYAGNGMRSHWDMIERSTGKLLASYPPDDASLATALRAAIMGNFVHTRDPAPDGQEVASEWYTPQWGCDTLDHVLDAVAALLRSEPQKETK